MTARQDYDPMVAVAANRTPVRLPNGRVGLLLWWSRDSDSATVYLDGRHIRITKDEVVAVVQNDTGIP